MAVPMRTSNECSSAVVVLESSSQAAVRAALPSSDKLESADIRWRTMIDDIAAFDDGDEQLFAPRRAAEHLGAEPVA